MEHLLPFGVEECETIKPNTMKTLKQMSAALILVLFSGAQNAGAQQVSEKTQKPAINTSYYSTAIGIRAGETSGLTFKHFVSSTGAFEGILGLWPNALGLTALYEDHARAFDLEGMNWYYGGGGHISFETRVYYQYNYGDRYFYRYRSVGNTALGIDGILGLEYKIKSIPFVVGLDMKPFLEVNSDGRVYTSLDPGLQIRVAF